jgi:membrane protein YqaA with SNARE-associated domain
MTAETGKPRLDLPRSTIRRLYDWCMNAAGKPHAFWTLGAVAFAESSFFPVPPDIMLIPMALAQPRRAFRLAAWCTLASVLGGALGYAIGALLYDSIGLWLIHLYGYGTKVEAFREAYAQWGAWIILLKGLTPIPFKVVTITSGFAGYNFGLFILFSVITRATRFFIVALLINRFGPQARDIIEKRLGLWAMLFAALVIGGLVAVVYLL